MSFIRVKISEKEQRERLKKLKYLEYKISKEITIEDPITHKHLKFIFEGFKEGGNERGEPLLVVRYPYSYLFTLYHIDYLIIEGDE